ncbi:PQQ-binding-like beta-propeller repeat protein [Halobellus ruber]|uniref:PQQ-binding-like beta-propeller repeat protein n=1 Tax=Halobellus ruber TaxID=2761102 RepID=A0A7J9SL40_9EURY|nr:PQQ-binding-like beta-propeller repeat protein [Halobellus ruber]MBB6647418.1 PQQ-binding-like beta-propeller repeat protein [Halobellus ruber]
MLAEGIRRPLGGLDPARSRHNWARSAVVVAEGTVLVGGPDGRVTAFGADTGFEEQWSSDTGSGYVVSLAAADDRVAVGTRGADAAVSLVSSEGGAPQWTHAAADEVGTAAADSLLARPYVVDVGIAGGAATGDDVIVAAIRRYERPGGERSWSSAVLGIAPDGAVRWRHIADASPVAVDVDAGRVAVAYNRRPRAGDGLVVLDAATGKQVLSWDPDAPGDRRVGDVAFADGAVAVASHADKRGYLLGPDGTEQWVVDLGSPRSVGSETVYTYPNHVFAADGAAVFVTGNTFAEATREPDARHPGEHTVAAVDGGDVAWTHDIGGFARDVSASGSHVAVPSAQHFRRRDADTHAVHVFDACGGHLAERSVPGIASSAAIGAETLAAVEEPVAYHDEDVTRGSHRLRAWSVGTGGW